MRLNKNRIRTAYRRIQADIMRTLRHAGTAYSTEFPVFSALQIPYCASEGLSHGLYGAEPTCVGIAKVMDDQRGQAGQNRHHSTYCDPQRDEKAAVLPFLFRD